MNFAARTLNKEIPIPLYYQLKEILLEEIKKSEPGTSLPTELELCEHFDISRPTVRQAINELVVEGYLTRMKGKGTFIAEPKIQQDFLIVLKSFGEEMQEKGLVPATKVLGVEKTVCDEKISAALNIPPGSEVIKLTRLRFADNVPIVLVVTFLPFDKLPDILSKDFENDSLYHIIEKEYGYKIERAKRTLEARIATEEAKLLEIKKGDPIQFIQTIAYLDDGTPIEFSLAEYRGDKSEFTFELKK
ncbi:transcriptional regulator [Candidatus Vecturithrix granuli]|uniref:Transcriptional regulator n=1 Tax=Vecturithrix granuli TaxID=1499967 RepID=A0A0S6W8V0_VECG1|nr:transcriptional regulator [Candidatus Vecturithrix granuli]